jgi:tRNA A-37 threonylcarbamoyl transferase component Bud32
MPSMRRETWGDFEIDTSDVVGRGGTAVVYAARQVSLDRPCVVKVFEAPRREPELQAELGRRFQNEARLVAKLRDSRIVQVYAAGEHDGRLWIAMERVDGETLETRLRAGASFPEPEVRRVAAELARALRAALASHQVVHRDLKPANVFLGRGGEVKLSDFGLARVLDKPGDRITQAGTVMGTPEYLAPEAIRGGPADHRADIYALGCLAYELAAQLPPFDGETHVDLFFKHVHERPTPPRDLVPELSEALNGLILRCLEKDPADRYQDYDSLLRDLETAAPATPAPKPRARSPFPGGVTAALILLAALAVWRLWPPDPEPAPAPALQPAPAPAAAPPKPSDPAPPDPEALLAVGDLQGAAALLADDRSGRLALVLAALGRYDAALRAAPDDDTRRVSELAASGRADTIEDLAAEAERAREIERLAESLRGRHAGAAWRVAAEAFSRLGARLRAEDAGRRAAEAWPGVRPAQPAAAFDAAALTAEARVEVEAGRPGPGAVLLALAHEFGTETLLNAALPLRPEIEAADRLEAGDEAAVLRDGAGTFAHARLVARIRERFLAGGFEEMLDRLDRWKVKAAEPASNRVEIEPGRMVLSSVSPAYLEFDGANPPGYRARLAVELGDEGWVAVVVHARGDDDMDLVVVRKDGVRCLRWRGGEESELASRPPAGAAVELDVVPHDGWLLLFVGGRYLHALELGGAAMPTRLRVGVQRATMILQKVEFSK